jgi:short-subunit dehydrogenase
LDVVSLAAPVLIASTLQNSRSVVAATKSTSTFSLEETSVKSSARATPLKTQLLCSMVRKRTQHEFYQQNILLTGASGGLGRSLALQLAHCGPKTLILSARNMVDLQAVAAECQAFAPDSVIHVITGDLADPASVQELAQQALAKCCGSDSDTDKDNTIDVLINNGGVSSRSRFVDTDSSVDERCLQVNFLAGAALAKAVVPGMLKNRALSTLPGVVRGRIVWISSVQGLVGIPNRSSYAASKFAVQGYCEALRAELYADGIVVHTVSPGYIRTNLSRSALAGSASTTHGVMDATTAAGALPDEVAAGILDRVAAGHVDFTIAAGFSARLAIWMRLLCPGVLRRLLVKRYQKSLVEKEKAE